MDQILRWVMALLKRDASFFQLDSEIDQKIHETMIQAWKRRKE